MSWYRDEGIIDVLVIGGGAREHALVWKLLLSPKVERVYVAPGNGGTALLAVPLQFDANSAAKVNLLVNWVFQHEIAFTLVGPEVPLAEGVVDVFTAMQQPIVGPTQAAARIESSKDWAKQFMLRHSIPTANATTFDEFEPLRQYLLAEDTSYPLVLKEDRLMAGKGVTIVHSHAEAIVWLARIAGTTIDRVVAADFVPNLPGAVAAATPMPSAAATAAAFGMQKSEQDEDILAAAIVKGMSAEQVEAIMRGDDVSREQMLGPRSASPAAHAPATDGEGASAETNTNEAGDVAKEDEFANDPTYLKIKHERNELFRRDGRKVLIEEYLEGPEVSVLAFSDGKTVKMMPPVCDYKRIGDGDSGPMTGGMGAYSPTSYVSADQLAWIEEHIIAAAINGMADEGHPYKGILYAGLIMTADGPKALEFNSRFGDPETQVLMMLLETDLVDICQAIIEERLAEQEVRWSSDACVAVILAAPGYPDAPSTGALIQGLDDIEPGVRVFHAGTRGGKAFSDVIAEMGGGERPSKKKKIDWRTFLGRIDVPEFVTPNDNAAVKALNDSGQVEMRTAGGRVLTVAATAPTLAEARAIAYRNAALINFPGKQLRTDIAMREIPLDMEATAPASEDAAAQEVAPEEESVGAGFIPPSASDEPEMNELTTEHETDTTDPAPAIGEAIGAAAGIEPSIASNEELPATEEQSDPDQVLSPQSSAIELGYSDEQRAAKLKALEG